MVQSEEGKQVAEQVVEQEEESEVEEAQGLVREMQMESQVNKDILKYLSARSIWGQARGMVKRESGCVI